MGEQDLEGAYRRWGAVIHRRCLALLGDSAAAEDATQEVFVRLMKHVGRLDPAGGYLPWIYRVATNHCLNVLRDGAWLEVRDPATLPDAPGEDEVGRLAERAVTAQLLRRFDEETRAIAVMSLVDGMTRDEVAEVLGISRKTVGRKLADFIDRAQRRLTQTDLGGA
jgi:RNA polymerase sigma-70 factor (ECF subfamily)